MATLLKWIGRALVVVWVVDGVACLYFKNRAISEMHNPACCKNAVSFGSLTDHPVLISYGTALGYHLTEWIFIACFVLVAALSVVSRRFAPSESATENGR